VLFYESEQTFFRPAYMSFLGENARLCLRKMLLCTLYMSGGCAHLVNSLALDRLQDTVMIRTFFSMKQASALLQVLRQPKRTAVQWIFPPSSSGTVVPLHMAKGGSTPVLEEDSSSLELPVQLLVLALCSFGLYGLMMSLQSGMGVMLRGLWSFPVAMLFAWCVTLPSFCILQSLLGGWLEFRTILIASSISMGVASMLLLAFIPMGWFFSMALSDPGHRFLVHMAMLGSAAACMMDVLVGVLHCLDPEGHPAMGLLWLLLFFAITAEFCYILQHISFTG